MALFDSGPTFTLGFPEGRVPDALITEINRRRLTFSFTDHARKSDTCQIELDNRDQLILDSGIFRRGTVVSVSWGYASRLAPTRSMVVKKLTGWDPVVVELKDASIMMARDRISWTYVDSTSSEAARFVAQRNGFSPEFIHITDTADRYETISQVSESDAAFLSRIAYKEGFIFYIAPDGLHWEPVNLNARPIRTIRLGDDESGPGDIIGIPSVTGNLLGLATTVISASDSGAASASDSTVRRVGLAPVNELAEDRDVELISLPTSSAGSVVATAGFGPGASGLSGPDPKTTLGGERPESRLVGVVREHDPDAKPSRRARAKYKRSRDESVKLELTIVGDPLVSARSIVKVVGVGRALDGLWYTKESMHRIGGGPYTTQLVLARDGYGSQLKSGDSRYDIGRALGKPGTRGSGRPGDGASAGADVITWRIIELQRLTQLRASGAPLNQLTALASRVVTVQRAWGQNGVGAIPQLRVVAGEAKEIAASLGDTQLTDAADALLSAVATLQPVEAGTTAQLNTQTPPDDGTSSQSLEGTTEETVDSEGRPALSFRPRGARIER